jgi:hypothetical protein
MPPKNNSQRVDDLLASVTADVLNGHEQRFQDQGIRVERILLEMVRPDPVQPRRVLPEHLHVSFHQNRLTPTQALRELVQLVQVAARQRGRPFQNVLELLPNPDSENDGDAEVKLSPEEQLLRDLVNLAVTIRDDGQVNPLTVVDVSQGVTRLFRIETGERRYWATWLMRDFLGSYMGDGMIPCIVISPTTASPFRQAKENTSRAGLNAIAMARQVALLLLHVHGFPMPEGPVNHDFYRQALELDLRGKREYTEMVYSALGGIGKMQFSQYKSLLRLCDEASEIADRHHMDEFRLRHIVDLEPQDQVEMLRQIIQLGLTAKQVKDLIENGKRAFTNSDDDLPSLPKAAVQMAKWVLKPDGEVDSYKIAEATLNIERDKTVAKARLRALREMLTQAEAYIDEL